MSMKRPASDGDLPVEHAGRSDSFGKPFVRVTGIREERFVEFDFSLGDPELTVELIMPFDLFSEFCARHRVEHLSPNRDVAVDYQRLRSRHRRPGVTDRSK